MLGSLLWKCATVLEAKLERKRSESLAVQEMEDSEFCSQSPLQLFASLNLSVSCPHADVGSEYVDCLYRVYAQKNDRLMGSLAIKLWF